MSYNNLRKGRFSGHNQIYFVTTVTHKRKPVFKNFNSARILIKTMKYLDETNHVNSLSWVVMPDHLHWLFQLGDMATLPEVMKRLKASSSRHINQAINSQRSIWQKSYYDRALRSEEDIRQLSRYIVANPMRAGLVKDIGDYSHWDAVWL